MKVQILIDNINSWIIPYAKDLTKSLLQSGHDASLLHNHSEVVAGDILVLLSCEKRFMNLKLNRNNLVVHESALPLGKGWSPLTWQVLEGKTIIPVTLFEAEEKIDAGPIYGTEIFEVQKTDLIDDLRKKQATATSTLIINFIKNYPLAGTPQSGPESFYPKRNPKDSELDLTKSIESQWAALQVADNVRYPAFVTVNGEKFYIRVSKE